MGAAPLQEGIIYTLNLVEDQALIAQGYEDIEYITPPLKSWAEYTTPVLKTVCVFWHPHI